MQNIFHAKKATSEDHPPPLVHLILLKLTVAIQEIPVLSDPEKMPATASPGNPWTKMIIGQQISFKGVSHHPLSTYFTFAANTRHARHSVHYVEREKLVSGADPS